MKQRKTAGRALLFWGPAIWFAACSSTGPAGVLPETAASTEAGISAEKAPAADAAAGGPETAASAETTAPSLAEALYQSCGELSANIPGPASVAVISIASRDPGEGEYAAEELTFFLVNSKKYRVLDRRSLDVIRAEQNFQLSGEVDDDTAVSIGHLIGAEIVITGSIVPYRAAAYLRLKALDVETGQIRAMSSRRFNSFNAF
jgi:hypothetical protein